MLKLRIINSWKKYQTLSTCCSQLFVTSPLNRMCQLDRQPNNQLVSSGTSLENRWKPCFFATDLGLELGLRLSWTVIVQIIIFPLGIYQSWKATCSLRRWTTSNASLRRSKNASKCGDSREIIGQLWIDGSQKNMVSTIRRHWLFAFVNKCLSSLPLFCSSIHSWY